MAYLIFDTETGGLGNDVSLLTAYFGLFNRNFVQMEELELNLIPDNGIYRVQPRALEVNKIDLTELGRKAIPYKAAKTELYNFLQRCAVRVGTFEGMNTIEEKKLIPVGQNVHFDVNILQQTIISLGSWEQFVSYRVLDTCVIARFLSETGKLLTPNGIGLGALAKQFGLDTKFENCTYGSPHEARYDTMITAQVLNRLMDISKRPNGIYDS